MSWPFAVAQLRSAYPTARWEVCRFDGLPFLRTECGYFVEVAVTVRDGILGGRPLERRPAIAGARQLIGSDLLQHAFPDHIIQIPRGYWLRDAEGLGGQPDQLPTSL